jgi:hypothetical protein
MGGASKGANHVNYNKTLYLNLQQSPVLACRQAEADQNHSPQANKGSLHAAKDALLDHDVDAFVDFLVR